MLDTKALAAALAPVIREAIETVRAVDAARIAALETRLAEVEGREPVNGKDGEPGPQGNPGPAGKNGIDGADGVGVAGALIDRDHSLILTLTNGEAKSLGVIVGRDGKDGEPGSPGSDGFSLDDFGVALKADGRTVELSFVRGDVACVRELALPTMIYRGVYVEGRSYEQGDTVTWAGSLWHCEGGGPQGEPGGATTEKPGEGCKAWTLAAKRGRDGKDFAGPQDRSPKPVRI